MAAVVLHQPTSEVVMRLLVVMLFALMSNGLQLAGQDVVSQTQLGHLVEQLQNDTTSDQAAIQLQALAKTDSAVKPFLSAQLPEILERYPRGSVWLNAVRLAGSLRVVSAVPNLVAELSLPTKTGVISFTSERRLEDDPPGKALAEIGEPATQLVAKALERNDKAVRWRAALVLMNINSTNARQALRRHLQKEPDPNLRAVIQDAID